MNKQDRILQWIVFSVVTLLIIVWNISFWLGGKFSFTGYGLFSTALVIAGDVAMIIMWVQQFRK